MIGSILSMKTVGRITLIRPAKKKRKIILKNNYGANTFLLKIVGFLATHKLTSKYFKKYFKIKKNPKLVENMKENTLFFLFMGFRLPEKISST